MTAPQSETTATINFIGVSTVSINFSGLAVKHIPCDPRLTINLCLCVAVVRPRSQFTSVLRYQALRELGSRLRSARIGAGLTQEETAGRLGVSAQTIRNWEAGRNEPNAAALDDIKILYEVGSPEISEVLKTIQATPVPALRYNRIPADAAKLREARASTGLTQAEVAAQTGISENSIGRYENALARPTFANLMKLAEAYDTPAWEFIADGNEAEVAYLFPHFTSSGRVGRLNMDDAQKAYETAKADLSPEAVRSIADYIRYIHQRELER